ncbi:class I SAM-dependent methyltransferase [archaeon]|nr:class I SAM-dependent methyltransferase [archaeon]
MTIQETVFDRITQMVPKSEGILDVGCGEGRLSRRLFENGYRIKCLDRVILCERTPGIEYYEADLSSGLPFAEGSIDNITFTEVFEHLKQPYTALHEFGRVLKKGGNLFMSIPNYWNIKHRLRYLLTGAIPTPLPLTRDKFEQFHLNNCSHINAMPWPTVMFALAAEGFEVIDLVSDGHYSLWKRPDYLPWFLLIHVYRLVISKKKRKLMSIDETASPDVLYKGSRVAIICRKSS